MRLCYCASQRVQENILLIPVEWARVRRPSPDLGPGRSITILPHCICPCGYPSLSSQIKLVSPENCTRPSPWSYLSKVSLSPSRLPAGYLLALQIFCGVEKQQRADGADVAGKTPKSLLSFILRLRLGVHTHRKVFQLLLGQDESRRSFSIRCVDPAPSQPESF